MNVHQLTGAAQDTRCAFVRQVEAGLCHPIDAGVWRGKARRRIRELHLDLMDYGLTPAEELELEQLEQLVGTGIDPLDLLLGALAFAFGIAAYVGWRLFQL